MFLTSISLLLLVFAARFHQVAPVSPTVDPTASPTVPPLISPATAAYPDDTRLDIALGMMRKGSYEVAALTATAVLKSRADVDRAYAILGIARNKQKKYEEARAALDKANASTQPFPERKHVPHFLGWCCYHLGDYPAARVAFSQHLQRVPDEPDSTFGLALVALGEDKLDEADVFFAKALKGFSEPTVQATDQSRVLTRMADLALRRDDVAKAEELLGRAIKANALQHEAWAKLARVKDRLGKTVEADAARANQQRILNALGRTASDGEKPAAAPPVEPKETP
jgi:Tfp pilus assembly protein PilF